MSTMPETSEYPFQIEKENMFDCFQGFLSFFFLITIFRYLVGWSQAHKTIFLLRFIEEKVFLSMCSNFVIKIVLNIE